MTESRDPSRTALATAYLRAAHQILDAKPSLLDDPIALRLLGPGAEQRIREGVERYRTPGALALRSHVVLRSRYAEDRLAASVQRGVSQYVIVGAGFDTFALRQPEWARPLKIIEIDHSASQTAKRTRIAEAGLKVPENLIFVDIDFERESLHDGLLRHGVTAAESTFFSWLGVTMYLTESAIDATLRTMAAFPVGSEVVVTFMQPPVADSNATSATPHPLARLVAEAGEPFVSCFNQAEFDERLRAAGFRHTDFLTPEIACSRYFAQSRTNLPPPKGTNIASAWN